MPGARGPGVSGPSQEAPGPRLTHRLIPGQEKAIQLDYAASRIVVSDPLTCDYRIESGGREIVVTAGREGHAVLTIWDENDRRQPDIEINVVPADVIGRLDALDPRLVSYPDVRARLLGTRVAITGTVGTAAEREAIQAIAAAAGDVVVLVSVSQTTPSSVPPPPPADARPRIAPPPAAAAPALPAGAATPVPLTSAPSGAAPPVSSAPTTPAPAAAGTRDEPPPAPTIAETPAVAPKPAGAPVAEPPEPAVAAPLAPTPLAGPRDTAAKVVAPAEPAAEPADVAAEEPAIEGAPVVAAPASTPVDYVVELLRLPAGASASAVLDPDAPSLFRVRLSTTNTTPVRHSIAGGSGTAAGRLDLTLEPLVDTGGVVHTTMTVGTDLKLRSRSGGGADRSAWVRAEVKFSSRGGEARAITEEVMAGSAVASEPGAEPASGERSDATGLAELFAAEQPADRLVVLVTTFIGNDSDAP